MAVASAELLRDFVNTYDVEEGREALAEPADLARWLAAAGLTHPAVTAPTTPADLRAAHELREALRSALRENHDGLTEHPELEELAGRHVLRLTFGPDGPALAPARHGGRPAQAALARIVAAVLATAAEGRWSRLKVCAEDACQWAFIDSSKNRSRSWCSMKVCGNRAKTRAYRARRRTEDDG
ncbi:MAG: hypothetical protein GEV11_10895 [Streptosporangiales bacterium]|nr:hypothetical protein [Streptosporangiales bacterium]